MCKFTKLCFVFYLLGYFASALAGGRIALVMGNANYEDTPLENSLHDAEDIAHQLSRLGFEVLSLTNGTQQQMEELVERFGQRLTGQEIGLFYYAGHGVQANGANYLIPVKSGVHNVTDLRYKAVDSQAILDKMEAAQVKTSIFILDACRDNPFRGMRGGSRGLANMSGPNGTIIAFATQPGNTAADGSGRNGLYTQYLLKHIPTPGLTIEQVFKRVRIDVDQASQGRQIPWENSSLRQDFCFVNCAATPTYVDSSKVNEINQEKDKLFRELTQIKSAFQNKQEQLQAFEQMRQEKAKLEQELKNLQQAFNTHQENTRELGKLKKQELDIEQALKNKAQTEAEKERLAVEKEKLLQDKTALSNQIARYESDQQQKFKKLTELEQENSRLTDALRKEQATATKQQTPEQSALIQAQLNELANIKQDKEALQAQLETQAKASQSMQEKLKTFDQLQRDKSNLEQQLAQLQKAQEANETNEKELKQLKQHERDIELSLKSNQQSEADRLRLASEKAKLQEDKALLTSRITRYEAEQQQRAELLTKLQQENAALQIELQTRQEVPSAGVTAAVIPQIGGF